MAEHTVVPGPRHFVSFDVDIRHLWGQANDGSLSQLILVVTEPTCPGTERNTIGTNPRMFECLILVRGLRFGLSFILPCGLGVL